MECLLQNCFISHIYGMLKDSDVRIRSEAANAILDFNTLQAQRLNKQTNMCVKSSTILAELVAETLLNEVPFSIDSSAGCSDGFHRAFDLSNSDSQQMGTILGKHLFDITNILFDLKSNEQLVWNLWFLPIKQKIILIISNNCSSALWNVYSTLWTHSVRFNLLQFGPNTISSIFAWNFFYQITQPELIFRANVNCLQFPWIC